MIIGRGDFGPDRFGEDAAEGVFVERDGFHAEHTPETRFFEGLFESLLRGGEGNIVEVDGHWGKYTTAEAGCIIEREVKDDQRKMFPSSYRAVFYPACGLSQILRQGNAPCRGGQVARDVD